MHIEPAADAFAERYARGEPQVVWTTLVADLETPVSAFLKVAGKPMSFLFESVEGGAVRGRYSVIGLKPDLIWRLVDGRAEINRDARNAPQDFLPCAEPPLEALRELVAESRIELPERLPPWRPAYSAISATTPCGWWESFRPSTRIRSAFPTPC